MVAMIKVAGKEINLETTSLPILGYTLMMAFRKVEISQAALSELMEECGLGEYAPKAPTAKATLRLALGKWIAGRVSGSEGADIGERVGIKVVNSSDNQVLTYLVTVEEKDRKQLSISLDTTMRVFLWKASDEIRVTLSKAGGSEADVAEEVELTRELGAIWSKLRGTIASKQVRELLCELSIKVGGVRMYPGASIFFLPVTKEEIALGIRALGKRLRQGGQDVTLRLYPHVNDQLAREEVAETAQAALLAEIELVGQAIDKSTDRENGARAGTISKRIAELEALKAKVAAYGDLGLELREERFEPLISSLMEKAGAIKTAEQLREERESEEPTQLVIPAALVEEEREEREV